MTNIRRSLFQKNLRKTEFPDSNNSVFFREKVFSGLLRKIGIDLTMSVFHADWY